MLITDLDAIRAAQTVKLPSSDDVRLACPHYTKGYVTAIYNHKEKKWCYGYHETRESAVGFWDELKRFCKEIPAAFNWLEYSEMYIYSAHGYLKADWALLGCVIDD